MKNRERKGRVPRLRSERIKIRERNAVNWSNVTRHSNDPRVFVSSHDSLSLPLALSVTRNFFYQTVSLVSAYLPRLYAVRELKLEKERCLLECFPSAGQCMLINLLDQFKPQDGVCGLQPFSLLSILPLSLSLSLHLSLPRFFPPSSQGSIAANDLLTHFAGRHL